MFTQIAQGKLAGSFINVSVVDGVERMYYFRKIPRYPLVVADGIGMQSILENHQRAKEALWIQAMAVSLLIIVLAFALTRYLKHIRMAMLERRSAQARAEDRSEQLNAIFALSPDGFISFDQSHRIKYASPTFHRLTGLANEGLIGMDEDEFSQYLRQICSESAPFLGISSIRKLNSEGQNRQIIELAGKSSRVLEVGLRESQAQSVSQILYFRDITYETQVDRMKSEFLSTAAHELRTPMASIYGYSELMLARDFNEDEVHEFLKIIYAQSERMISIINELLDLARIESRHGKDFDLKRLDLARFLEECVHGYILPAGRLTPHLQFGSTRAFINADSNKLTQALNNVLSNAYKYSPNGGDIEVTLIVPDQSHHNAPTKPQRVGICVTDHGIGMTEYQLSRMFERFYRADTSGRIPGTGLGMSIVREIVQIHGGEVVISSQLGTGTSVTLWLPISQSINAGLPNDAVENNNEMENLA
jgi:signal transduction histidine kinase